MNKKLNPLMLGYTATIVSALCMLVLGILGSLGIYTGAVEMMQKWHIFFSLSIGGIIAGMIEAAVGSFILIYIFAWLYNKLTKKKD